jgi:hypothetical protein
MVSSVSRRRATVCKLSGQRERKQAMNYQLCFKDRAHPGGGVDFAAFRRQARCGFGIVTQVVSDQDLLETATDTARKPAGARQASKRLMKQSFRLHQNHEILQLPGRLFRTTR